MTASFAPPGPEQRAAVESTATWYWLADLSRDQGVGLTLGRPEYTQGDQLRGGEGRRRRRGRPAAALAPRLRADLIPAVHPVRPELRDARDLLRQRLVLVAKRARRKDAVVDLPALPRFQCELHAEQRVLPAAQRKRLGRRRLPTLVPDADVRRPLWIPGTGEIAAFALHLEIDGIERFRDVRAFLPYGRLAPGAKNSGGRTRHKRTKDGDRHLKLAFSHAAVRAIQYYPEIKAWCRTRLRAKGPMPARALVAKELARTVYHVLAKQQASNGGTLSRTKRSPGPVDGPPRTPSRPGVA